MKIILRAFDPDKDSGLIYDSYPKGVFHGAAVPILVPKSIWMKAFYKVVRAQLETASVRIACSQEEPDTILGYSIISGKTLHFVYVKSNVRKQGIGNLLTRNKFTDVDNLTLTKVGSSILKNRKKGETNE